MEATREGGRAADEKREVLEGLGTPPAREERVSERSQEVGHRRYVRLPVAVPVVGRADQFGETELQGTVRTVSGGGLMAEFPVQIVPGTVMALVLQTRHGPLPVTGQIAWTGPPSDAIRHGVAFSEPKGHAFALTLFLEANR